MPKYRATQLPKLITRHLGFTYLAWLLQAFSSTPTKHYCRVILLVILT